MVYMYIFGFGDFIKYKSFPSNCAPTRLQMTLFNTHPHMDVFFLCVCESKRIGVLNICCLCCVLVYIF